MSRTIDSAVMAELERPQSGDALLWFMTITHANIKDTIRFVGDNFDYLLDGNTYVKARFSGRPVTDTDQQASMELTVPNVDRRIGQALEKASGYALVSAAVYTTADFDLTVEPRVPLVASPLPTPVYQFDDFRLINVEVKSAVITGRVVRRDFTLEPWPSIRATSDVMPGLFA